MKLVVSSGGTGGHIFPAVSLIHTLRERCKSLDVFFISTAKRLDRKILGTFNYRHEIVYVKPPPHRPSVEWIRFLYSLTRETKRMRRIMKKFHPDVAIGFGGYGSLPALLAARTLRVPIVIHEQNVKPGLANRFLGLLAGRVAVSFPEAMAFFGKDKTVLTGNPVRKEVIGVTRDSALLQFPRLTADFTLLVMGGSQGADKINRVFTEALPGILKRHSALNVIHIAGERNASAIRKHYESLNVQAWVFPFLDEIGLAYRACDLVIGRAGATSIAELAALGKPAILIPFPRPQAGQIENAKALSAKEAAIVISEDEFSPQRLEDMVISLITNRAARNKLAENVTRLSRPDAAKRLADEVLKIGSDK